MRRSYGSLLVCLGILLLLTGQAGADTPTIALNEGVHLALQESIDCKIAQLEWENGQIAYQKAMADNLLAQSSYNQGLAELNLMKADAAYRQSIANVVISVVRRFSDVRLAMMDLQIKERQLRLSEKGLELTQKKVKTQNASEYDLLQAEADLAKSQFDYHKSRDNLEEKQQAFFLSISSDEMVPDGKLSFVPFEVEIAEILPEVLQSSVDIKEALDSLELARLDLERLLLDETAALVVRDAQNQVSLAELRVEQVRAGIIQDVQSAFNSVRQAEQTYRANCLSYELEKKQYQITQGQVDAGLKTEDDLLKAQISLWEAERSVFDALSNYVITYLEFDELIGKDVRKSAVLQEASMGVDG